MTQQPKALLVDDNALNSRLAATLLRRLGWLPQMADDGLHALALLAAERFDLVLLDLRMPLLGGEEVCRRIREDLRLRELPVIAYTAHGMPEEQARIVAAGFNGLLLKPTSFHDMRLLCQQYAPSASL
ncbi:response regulator [Azohydromonas aeria]|uniref:response regulator n=1 Tax=Azohydromonas aeria TaxID=2590212 RepID=UPI0012F8595B|nr:response regulator [Azohydromonas aeria]